MADRIKVLTITEQIIPSNAIGIIKPMLALQENNEVEFSMQYARSYKQRDIAWADVVILCRSIRPDDLKIIEYVRKHRKKLIYDIDDNFFELSIDNPLGRYHRHPVHLFVLEQMLKNADLVRVYSKPMEEIALRYNKCVSLVRSYFDFSLIKGLERTSHPKIKIVYATSRGPSDTLAQVYFPAIFKILHDYEDQVEFYVFGPVPKSLKGCKNVYSLNYIKNYTKFIQFFYKQSFDIGLAPLKDDRFHNSKTNNKFREYGAMGVCGIYSDAQIYRDCVVNYQNGILVDETTESWYQALKNLIIDKNLRERIKESAVNAVLKDYSMSSALDVWRSQLLIPVQFNCEYKNILRLKLALIHDDSLVYANIREQELTNLVGFCSIQHDDYNFYSDSLLGLEQYDLVLAFIGESSKANLWINELKLSGAKQLVVDTLEPIAVQEPIPNVVFTNLESKCEVSSTLKYENVDVIDAAAIKQLFSDNFQYIEGVKQAYRRMNQYNQKWYSDQSPMLLWANLLSSYQGTFYEPWIPLLVKMFRKVLEIASSVTHRCYHWLYVRTIAPMLRVALSIRQKTANFVRFWGDYILVNILKKY